MSRLRTLLLAGLLTTLGAGCDPSPIEGVVRLDRQAFSADDAGPVDDAPDSGPPTAPPPGPGPSPTIDAGSEPAPDSGPAPDAGPPPAPDAGPPPAMCGDGTCQPEETCDVCAADCGDCGWPERQARAEDDMVGLVNRLRAQGARCGTRSYDPAGPVEMNNELRNAARAHSTDMADNDYFAHASQDGRSPWERISAAGYRGQGVGENIAAGNSTAQATFDQWLNSPGHCSNMMNPSANEMGVGFAVGSARYGSYWTQVFGRR